MERYLIRYMIGCKQNQFCGGILCKNLISSFARNVFCAEKREVTVKFLVQILRDFASSNPDICLKPAFFRQFNIADAWKLGETSSKSEVEPYVGSYPAAQIYKKSLDANLFAN